jgi:hypothetical protein
VTTQSNRFSKTLFVEAEGLSKTGPGLLCWIHLDKVPKVEMIDNGVDDAKSTTFNSDDVPVGLLQHLDPYLWPPFLIFTSLISILFSIIACFFSPS